MGIRFTKATTTEKVKISIHKGESNHVCKQGNDSKKAKAHFHFSLNIEIKRKRVLFAKVA